MTRSAVVGTVVLAALLSVAAISQTGSKGAKPSASVARGKYLVVNVGMCSDCHTPADRTGRPIKGQFLKGAPLMFKPTVPVPGWMTTAPGIAGGPGGTEEQGS